MQVALLFYEPPEDVALRTDPGPAGQAYWGGWHTYMGALREAGLIQSGNPLLPATSATTVRRRGDATEVLDGPFAETREQLGGYVVIEAADPQQAAEWAARCPCAATGAVEIRPIMPMKG